MDVLQNELDVSNFFSKWKQRQAMKTMTTVPINITDIKTHGLATTLEFRCGRCELLGNNDGRWRSHAATYKPKQTEADEHITKSDLCKYDINLKLCLAFQLMGVGGEHARTITSFLDLPEPHKWPRQFNVLENFLHKTTEAVKCQSQDIAVEEEKLMTNVPDSSIEQTLIEDCVPRAQIEASYDMGWQVRSSGGKYGSPTGHGLMIGALSKKVLDSVNTIKNVLHALNARITTKNISVLKTTKVLQSQWKHQHLPRC